MKHVMLALLILVAAPVFAEPIAVMSLQGITVTLTNQPCAIKYVTNLPLRATWKDGSKTFDGCYAVFPESEAIGFWFDDGSVAVIPAHIFKPVTAL